MAARWNIFKVVHQVRGLEDGSPPLVSRVKPRRRGGGLRADSTEAEAFLLSDMLNFEATVKRLGK